jgi:transcriptional regulator with XRE-family HTH domain
MEKTEFSKKFAIRLARAIDGRKLTSISRKIGCSRSLLSKYLSGDLPEILQILSNLGKEYSVDLHWLLTGILSPSANEIIAAFVTLVFVELAKTKDEIKELEAELKKLQSGCITEPETLNIQKDLSLNKVEGVERIQAIRDKLEYLQDWQKAASDVMHKVTGKWITLNEMTRSRRRI